MQKIFIFITSILMLIACAVPQKSLDKNVDKNSHGYKLEEARMSLTTGDFVGAEEKYLKIYNDENIPAEFRETAMFNLGMMYSDAAENIEDYEIALKYLRQLSADFPKTQYKEKTNREIRYIKNQIKRIKQ
jgi:outer membrane protein assembly factor BamD (BamD/ComL family)